MQGWRKSKRLHISRIILIKKGDISRSKSDLQYFIPLSIMIIWCHDLWIQFFIFCDKIFFVGLIFKLINALCSKMHGNSHKYSDKNDNKQHFYQSKSLVHKKIKKNKSFKRRFNFYLIIFKLYPWFLKKIFTCCKCKNLSSNSFHDLKDKSKNSSSNSDNNSSNYDKHNRFNYFSQTIDKNV